ncbi:antitoxin MazE family protein [Microcella sp.]|uniref:antitoxin MazE family protein n=1 Tax=Microcella sp. TaxID=1913979 RepID=UPI00256534DA|nr:antitoxin MazE family protein [Microcella sp.]MBX9472288.1 antitoxin MazE family protein [Microcella sp.]
MSSRARVSAYRDRLRAEGLRPVQVWVPDVRSTSFAVEAQRQAASVAAASVHSDDMQFVEAISTSWDE